MAAEIWIPVRGFPTGHGSHRGNPGASSAPLGRIYHDGWRYPGSRGHARGARPRDPGLSPAMPLAWGMGPGAWGAGQGDARQRAEAIAFFHPGENGRYGPGVGVARVGRTEGNAGRRDDGRGHERGPNGAGGDSPGFRPVPGWNPGNRTNTRGVLKGRTGRSKAERAPNYPPSGRSSRARTASPHPKCQMSMFDPIVSAWRGRGRWGGPWERRRGRGIRRGACRRQRSRGAGCRRRPRRRRGVRRG